MAPISPELAIFAFGLGLGCLVGCLALSFIHDRRIERLTTQRDDAHEALDEAREATREAQERLADILAIASEEPA